MKYNSRTVPGHDYSFALRDILPDLIGSIGKPTTQISEEVGRKQQSVSLVLRRLHEQGAVHIESWSRGKSGPYMAHYRWGAGDDAEKPAPISNSVKHKKYRESAKGRKTVRECNKRWRKSENGKDYSTRYFKGRYAREKYQTGGVAAIDPLLAALMGIPSERKDV